MNLLSLQGPITGSPGKSPVSRFKISLSFHPNMPATIQDQLTMGTVKVSIVASVTYQLCCGWQAACTSDLRIPGGDARTLKVLHLFGV